VSQSSLSNAKLTFHPQRRKRSEGAIIVPSPCFRSSWLCALSNSTNSCQNRSGCDFTSDLGILIWGLKKACVRFRKEANWRSAWKLPARLGQASAGSTFKFADEFEPAWKCIRSSFSWKTRSSAIEPCESENLRSIRTFTCVSCGTVSTTQSNPSGKGSIVRMGTAKWIFVETYAERRFPLEICHGKGLTIWR